MRELILASESPRRREMLADMGLPFRAVSPSVDEGREPGEPAATMVARLAAAKARRGAELAGGGVVIGADSAVVVDARIMGKPATEAEAWEMLQALRDRDHTVVTGVVVEDTETGRRVSGTMATIVRMRDYSDGEIAAYVKSGEAMDKAGGYAIQDRRFRPAGSWEGCYTNIMGLPMCLLADLLQGVGVDALSGRVRVPEECSPCPFRGIVEREESGWTS